VNTLLVDPPPAPDSEQPSASESPGPPAGSLEGEQAPQPSPGHSCANCGGALRDDQQWCLACGAGQPGSLGERTSWRPLSTLAIAAALLVVAAAVVGAEALKGGKAAPPARHILALAPATTVPATTAPATPGGAKPVTPATPGVTKTPIAPTGAAKAPSTGKAGGSSSNFLFPSSTSKPPKIPPAAATPKSTSTPTSGSTGSGSKGSGSGSTTTPAETNPSETATGKSQPGTGGKSEPTPILLDTNAASTYNPYNYPAAGFGDPALAIDGEASTAWTAAVQPSSAPRMAEGLLVDLRSSTRIGSVKLRTTTPGMAVQLYGAIGPKAPAAITDPGWTPLDPGASRVLTKKTTIKLRGGSQRSRFLVVWIVRAPTALVGASTPGRVSLNEVELLPPAA
jgi:hypothetical protein